MPSKERKNDSSPNQRMGFLVMILLVSVVVIFWLLWAQPWRALYPNNGYRYVVGVSQQNLLSTREMALKRELMQVSLEYDDINLVFANAGGSIDRQHTQIEELLLQGADAVLVDTGNAEALSGALEAVRENGAVLILIGDENARSIPCDVLLTYDYASMGNLAGEYLAQNIEEAGSLLEVQGFPRSGKALQMQSGLRQGLAEEQQVVCVVAGYDSRTMAAQRVRDTAPASVPFEADGIFAHDAQLAWGAWDALGALPTVCAMYGEEDLPFDAIVTGQTGGNEALTYAAALLTGKGEGIPTEYVLPIWLIPNKGGE